MPGVQGSIRAARGAAALQAHCHGSWWPQKLHVPGYTVIGRLCLAGCWPGPGPCLLGHVVGAARNPAEGGRETGARQKPQFLYNLVLEQCATPMTWFC